MSDTLRCPTCNTEHKPQFDIKPGDKRTYKGRCQACHGVLKFKMGQYDHNGLLEQDSISFTINGKLYTVDNQCSVKTTLNDYLRNTLSMTGTKVTCREGGCGACVVNLEVYDYTLRTYQDVAVNSCLFPIYSCNGLRFTTIEGVGSKSAGFNPIQNRIVDSNGTQCGWCTPGMVMNMYSLLLNNPKPSKDLIEHSFDGHICRCTGYRSILDAMKSFASDEKPIDIEELYKLKCLNDRTKDCSSNKLDKSRSVHVIREDGTEWYIPKDLNTLLTLLDDNSSKPYRIISGNTSIGVYKNPGPYSVYLDVKNIPDLYTIQLINNTLSINSRVTLKTMIDAFNSYSTTTPGFEYLSVLATHIGKIANVSVRNAASWSGNLMMKHDHLDFPSDVFICLETVNASITLITKRDSPKRLSPLQFLQTDMKNWLMYSVQLPSYDPKTTLVKTFKIMPRSQNSHAYVNAGFRFTFDPNTYKVTETPAIVIGGIGATFTHAFKTEAFWVGKSLRDPNALSTAVQLLSSELDASMDSDPVLASTSYRKSLALGLFYKFVLQATQSTISPRNQSALIDLISSRPVSSGQQVLPSVDPNIYPVTKPMSKLNAALQASGEAQYTYDKLPLRNQLEGVFIISSLAACRLDQIDTSEALAMPGVVKIFFAKDIKGTNSFVPTPLQPEKLFADDYIDYAGQAIGLVVAETIEQAQAAAKAVKITYKEKTKPILTVKDAIKAGSLFPPPMPEFKYGNAEQAIAKSPCVLEGECFLDTQFHFYMEPANATAEPTEDGLDIHCPTQWTDLVQNGIAQLLGMASSSKINVFVKQLGGAYGGRITRSNIPATAAALAAQALNKPVRVAIDLNTNMLMMGKRFPWYAQYKIGFEKNGALNGILLNWYCDSGNNPNDNAMGAGPLFVDNVYKCPNWHIISNLAKTNLPANTAVRSPGFFPSIAIMETMIEHVSKYLAGDPLSIRRLNLYHVNDVTPAGQPLPYFNVDKLMDQLLASSDYVNRVKEIDGFNQANRWKKRGISLTPIKWGVGWTGGNYNCFISVYASDGSVSVCHAGVEMGQGIHTKVSAVVAYKLNIPMETISIKGTNNIINPNAQASGGSITSELVCKAAMGCCDIINANLDPVRKQMPPKYTWPELIAKANSLGVDLAAHYWLTPQTPDPFEYNVYGVAVSEAVIDVLTGETQILSTEMLYDGGQSLNGEIDIGQAEGAFVMGMGFWLHEKVRYDPDSGLCLTNGTWEYKPPTTRDIPIKFNVSFLQNSPNKPGVLGSKAVGEPPLCLTPSVAFCVRQAIHAARREIGKDAEFFQLVSPITVESVQQLCLVDPSQFTY